MNINKKWNSVVLESAALILFLIFVSTAASATPEQGTSPVINITQISYSGIATHPNIYDNKIVWEEDNLDGYASNIYVYNLSTSKVENFVSASGSPPCPVINGNTITWTDARNGHIVGKGYIKSSDIYIYNLSTRKETLVTEPPCNAGSPDIYGDWIVWEDGTKTVNIYIYNIFTHDHKVITPFRSWRSAINPAIYGDKVVYQDGRNGYPQIYMYNISSGTETLIPEGKGKNVEGGVEPDIYGDKVVWVAYDTSNTKYGNIYMYNISTSKLTKITTSGSAENPAIYGNRIVWEDYRHESPDIYMYDISTSQETRITSSGLAIDPAINDNKIVWTYGRYRDSNIYMATISEKTIHTKPVAAFSASPTSGTFPLTVKFTDKSTGSPTSWKWSFGDGATKTSQNPIHIYSKAGNYNVKLTATNTVGSSTVTKTNYIKVTAPIKPVAAFSASSTSGKAPLTVAFTEKSTGSPTSWRWSFGDGAVKYSKNPIHKYSKAGTYTVKLTATNTVGSSTVTKTNYIKVTTV